MRQLKRRFLTALLILSVSCTSPMVIPNNHYDHATVTVQAKAKYVYITRTGKCYHTHKCGNGTYYKAKLKTAKSMGLRKCKKCY